MARRSHKPHGSLRGATVDLAGRPAAELAALLEAVQELRSVAELAAWQVAAAFDAGRGWADDGAASAGAWLRHRAGLAGGEATAIVRSGRRLRDVTGVEAAVADGRLSSAKARVVTRTLTDDTVGAFAEMEDGLVDRLAALSAADCATVMRYFQAVHETEPDEGEDRAEVHLSRTLDGTYALNGTLDAEGGATLGTAIDALVEESYRNDTDTTNIPIARRRADALVELARRAMAGGTDTAGATSPARPSVTLTVPLELLTGDDDADTDPIGPPGGPLLPVRSIIERALARRAGPYELAATDLTPATRRRLTCDCALTRLVLGPGSVPLDLGRSTRTPSAAQHKALAVRDRGCTFPSCDRPPQWCHGHHLQHWTRDGPTDLTNLVLLCSNHHHAVHDRGFSVTRRPDGTLRFARPDGLPIY